MPVSSSACHKEKEACTECQAWYGKQLLSTGQLVVGFLRVFNILLSVISKHPWIPALGSS